MLTDESTGAGRHLQPSTVTAPAVILSPAVEQLAALALELMSGRSLMGLLRALGCSS